MGLDAEKLSPPEIELTLDAAAQATRPICRGAATIQSAPLCDSSLRALAQRIKFMEAEQAAAGWEMDQLYARANQICLECLERQQRLRKMRYALLMQGGAHGRQ